MLRLLALVALLYTAALAQPKRVLYVTHSAGYRHDSLTVSQQVLSDIATRSEGKLQLTATEDLSALSDLSSYSAVFFFTSGELALSETQKRNLLAFVRNGGGFGGAHSATDTFYTWPEYGELIGARFDGHPWVHEVRIDVEDPDHPASKPFGASFRITDEIYQFREFNRSNVRVLMTLDTNSIDLSASGVNRTDKDFALAWARPYGAGRVFYTALGHFDGTWRDPKFQQMLEQALLWLTGQVPGDASPRAPLPPAVADNAIGNSATLQPAMQISPGSYVSVYGSSLTSGATMQADPRDPPFRLAGTRILLDDKPAQISYASPQQINFIAPLTLDAPKQGEFTLEVPGQSPIRRSIGFVSSTAGVFVTTADGRIATVWCTGLGALQPNGPFLETVLKPKVTVNDMPAVVLFSGLSPGFPGLYQINVELPAGVSAPFRAQVTMQ